MKYETWLKKLQANHFKFGECNCPDCRDAEINFEKLFEDAVADLYPYWSNNLPNMYRQDKAYLNRNTDLRYMKYGTQDYWVQLLVTLRDVERWNEGAKEQFPAPLIYCVDCGCLHNEKEHVDGKPICHSCFDRYYMTCGICGETKGSHGSIVYQPEFDYQKWNNGRNADVKRMCRACYAERFMKCSRCSMPVDEEHWHNVSLFCGHEEEMTVHPMRVAENAQVWDEEFGEFVEADPDVQLIERPHAVHCDTCNEGGIKACDRCGDQWVVWKLRKMIWRGDEMTVCPKCVQAKRVIKAYDYAVKPQFAYASAEPTLSKMLHYGVEIEMEYIKGLMDGDAPHLERQGQRIMDWWPNDFCYIKHDGTLEYGYEAVTHPFTWGWFQENKDKWIEFLLWLRELGFKANYYSPRKEKYTCGMHVHMSKDGFSRMHLYKFVHFMYKKSTRPFVNAIAERAGSQYADFQVADAKYAHRVGKDKKNASGKRHSAINLLGGHAHEHGRAPKECQTCEVRIFQGYLEPVKFFKNMEFLQSLYEFTACHSPREMQLKKYLEYLVLKPNKFPALLNFIKYNKDINGSYAYVRKLMKGV